MFSDLTDIKLAAQVGLLLLRNNKELELVLDATQKEYEEQHMRAEVSDSFNGTNKRTTRFLKALAYTALLQNTRRRALTKD